MELGNPPTEPAVPDNGTITESAKSASCSAHGLRVAVEADNPQSRESLKQGCAMAAKTDGAVHDNLEFEVTVESGNHGSQKDGNVFGHVFTQPPQA